MRLCRPTFYRRIIFSDVRFLHRQLHFAEQPQNRFISREKGVGDSDVC